MFSSGSLSAFDIFVGGTGALVTSATILRSVVGAWRKTLGRRWAFARQVTSLRIGMSTDFVVQVLGVPAFGSITESQPGTAVSTACAVWPSDYGLLACQFSGGQLVAFTILATDRWFRPKLEKISNRQIRGRLGGRTFEALAADLPAEVCNRHGASSINYAEHHHFGRPGAYNDFVLNASGIGTPSPAPLGCDIGPSPPQEEAPALVEYRRRIRPNAVTVTFSRGAVWQSNFVLVDALETVALRHR